MARHFLELTDAKTMSTTGFGLVELCLGDCVDALAMGVVHGPAGVGKTFAVEHASERAELPLHWLTFPKQPAITHILKRMLEEVTGFAHHGERFKLQNDLLSVLAEKPRLVVVDEAQQLNADAFDILRFLHDDPETRFSLVFVGGHGCWKTLSRHQMLLSRIYRVVSMTALSENEVLDLLPHYHPIYKTAEPETLLLVNERFCEGNFRRWASFTSTIAGLCKRQKRDTFDEKLALAALTLLPNWSAHAA